MSHQQERARAFREMHRSGEPIVLCNVWDVASARVVAAVPGMRALATASWSVSAALGHADLEGMPLDDALAAISRIVAGVDLPVSADFEKGYASDLETLAANARHLIATGAIGFNLEDSIGQENGECWSIADATARIRTVRDASTEADVPMVINARTDIMLGGASIDDAIARGRVYLDAGADCIFLLGARGDDLARAVKEIGGPVSVMATAGGPTIPELAAIGVARVSVGPGSMGVAYAALDRLARTLATASSLDSDFAFRPGKS